MPQSHILECCLSICANYTGQPADLFAGDRVALVRHGRRALLLFAEVLLGFPNFCSLQVTDLSGDLIQRAGGDRQSGNIRSMAIALNHLRGNRRCFQPEACADLFLVLGIEMAEASNRSRELSHPHIFGRVLETGNIPLDLREPVGQLQSKGGRLSVYAMSTADGGRVLEFEGTALNDLPQFAQILENQLRRLFDLEGLCCIHYIIRRETVMQPPRLRSDLLRDSRGKGNYVM